MMMMIRAEWLWWKQTDKQTDERIQRKVNEVINDISEHIVRWNDCADQCTGKGLKVKDSVDNNAGKKFGYSLSL